MSKLLLSAAVTIVLTSLVVERLDGRMSAADQAAAASTKSLDSDCKAGDASACFDLAFRYQQGEGVREDERRALVLYEKACTGGVVAGCVNAAFRYEDVNPAKALGLFRAACDGPDHDVQGYRPHQIACEGVTRLGSSVAGTSPPTQTTVSTSSCDSSMPKSPNAPNPKDVVKVGLDVIGQFPEQLVPGTEYEFILWVHKKNREQYLISAPDGRPYLNTKYLCITLTPPLRIDWKTMKFSLPADVPLQSNQYTFRVEYVGSSAPPLEVTFTADLAIVNGPEPADVRTLKVLVGGRSEPDNTLIQPGLQYPVIVVVTDAKGREYRTVRGPNDSKAAPLPLSRLNITPTSMAWNPPSLVTPSANEQELGRQPYALRVEYAGRSDLAVTRTFIPDFAAIRGPNPVDVAAVNLVVDGLPPSGLLPPGSELKARVEIRDRGGRAFSTQSMPALARRLRVTGSHVTVDLAAGTIKAAGDCESMKGQTYVVSVTYEDRRDLERVAVFKPDFAAALKEYLPATDRMEFSGEAGAPGANGADGNSGVGGQSASDLYGTGSSGTRGGSGRPGQAGRRGERGPRVRVLITEATSLDGSQVLMMGEVTAGQQAPKYFVRPLQGKPLVVASSGGRGGKGGAGGRGANGGDGGEGYSTGSGGDGGSGGSGGRGGDGGAGGDILVVASSEELLGLVEAESVAGPAGPGGAAGTPGRGGAAGVVAGWRVAAVGTQALGGLLSGGAPSLPEAYIGSAGAAGDRGDAGDEGLEGANGNVEARVGAEVAALRTRLPEPLARCVALPSVR